MTLGIIDVGTNSIHLLIGILGLHGRFHTVLKERDLTRLGEGGLTNGRLTKTAMHRAFELLDRYASTMKRCRVEHVEAVATSAVRGAKNKQFFVRQVRRLGIPLRVIGGREEARLIYLGVLQAHRFRGRTLVMTIGGGSAQVIIGDGTRLRYATSVLLGGARLAQQFIHHDPPRAEEIEALRTHVRRIWRPVAATLHRHRWQRVVGSSAMIAQLILVSYLRTHDKPPKKRQAVSIGRSQLKRLVHWLSDSTSQERIRLAGVDPRREDLLLTTAVVLLELMELADIDKLQYAPGSLREGLVIDYLLRHRERRRARQRFEDPLEELFAVNTNGDFVVPWRKQVLKHLRER